MKSGDLWFVWAKVITTADSVDVNEPHLARRYKLPPRFHSSSNSAGHVHDTPKAYYQQLYYEALDNSIMFELLSSR